MIVTKVLAGHRPDCSAVRNWPDNPWAFFEDGRAEYRDAIGRKNSGIGQRFISLRCNGYNCEARVLVREADLTRLVQVALKAHAPASEPQARRPDEPDRRRG